MLTVRHAAFRRVLARGRQLYGEVEVHTDLARAPRLLAYFRKEDDGRLQLVRVMKEDSYLEPGVIGVVDLPVYAATEDVTEQLFSGPDHAAGEDRHVFGRQIVAIGEVRQALEQALV
ncbi:hypothetical protein SAMN05216312_10798 [Cohnella sp. OV330]|uniref:hypothetical protein n=1 Tax=Cohnella sp. OV330 TaxID=1855288 RepID=UPI0008F368AA|nr:hypothetical protein [Cohnella sp. OV330]SFB39914.1 hypothetical protein SAMN05216312_10798 [Cohnella sp. OV330]